MVDDTQEQKQQTVSDANDFLKSGASRAPEALLNLANKLIDCDQFSSARSVLERAAEQDIADGQLVEQIAQKRALATYKDPEINREQALDLAIGILRDSCDINSTKNQETLGLAGAIYKRMWEVGGSKINLEQSLKYYERGYKYGIANDDGYTAINAAYIHDLLAFLEEKQAQDFDVPAPLASKHRKEAEKIRTAIIQCLPVKFVGLNDEELEKNYWPVATLMEAYFGLGNFEEAGKWLRKIREMSHIPEWHVVSTAKQLVQLTRLQVSPAISDNELEKTEAWKMLLDFAGRKAYALRSMLRGKVGMALSGGGFRASLYHIGVLAKLAEYDLLRHIEVLSCVSGGSIIGVHYYLELRRLINVEKKSDESIGCEDYIKLIETIADDFLAGVQQNPRVRLLANPWINLKLLFSLNYSRTQRLGELYEELIYSRIKDGEGANKRWLNNLYIYPEGKKDFLPRRDNWSRQSKIPELVLNATTLNTGHNWQYTASWMGESPTAIDTHFDSNDRYRRAYYHEVPDAFKNVRLGSAVGASSCVPGLFEPLILSGLYQDTTVRLVDGGIYDNQGIESLLEQDCNVVIVSDASGQLATVKEPGGGIVKPLLRSTTTVMERVRTNQLEDLKTRMLSGILKGFTVVHLKQGLESRLVETVNNTEAPVIDQNNDATTPYGIRKDVQQLLSAVRTDLDSFSDLEAYALMTSGYNAMEVQLQDEQNRKLFALDKGQKHAWKFLQVEAAMKQKNGADPDLQRLKANLRVSPMRAGKVWKLYAPLKLTARVLAVVIIISLIGIWVTYPDLQPFMPLLGFIGSHLTISVILGTITMLLLANLITALIGSREGKLVNLVLDYKDIPRRLGVGFGFGLFGWILALIHLEVFDKWFKSVGRVK